MTEVKTRRRWPLLLIAAPGAVAVWSGWVGLGEMTGFGVVQPLPGIWDELQVNTAITLPIGVEAYAVWALAVATDRKMPDRARRFAGWSSGAGLLIGLGGQVAYHLMANEGITKAPWQVVTAVSSLPVLVVGAAAFLWHLTSGVEPKRKASSPWKDRLLAEWDKRTGSVQPPAPSPGASPVTSPATVPAPPSVGSVPAGGALTSSASAAGGGGLRAVPSQSDGGKVKAAQDAAAEWFDKHGRFPSKGELARALDMPPGTAAHGIRRAKKEVAA